MIQGRSSTNWKPVLAGSNPFSRNSDRIRLNTLANSATQRALLAVAASLPRRNSARMTAATAGMKMMIERR